MTPPHIAASIIPWVLVISGLANANDAVILEQGNSIYYCETPENAHGLIDTYSSNDDFDVRNYVESGEKKDCGRFPPRAELKFTVLHNTERDGIVKILLEDKSEYWIDKQQAKDHIAYNDQVQKSNSPQHHPVLSKISPELADHLVVTSFFVACDRIRDAILFRDLYRKVNLEYMVENAPTCRKIPELTNMRLNPSLSTIDNGYNNAAMDMGIRPLGVSGPKGGLVMWATDYFIERQKISTTDVFRGQYVHGFNWAPDPE